MPRLTNKVPAYRRHKASGQAVVTLNGCDFYLGPWKSAASRREYDRVIGEWLANGKRPPAPTGDAGAMTIIELIAAFDDHAKAYYRRPDGSETNEVHNFKLALRPVRQLYGHTLARDFGPLCLKAVQERMIGLGWCRNTINSQAARVKHVFKWAVSQQLVPPSVYHGLQAVAGLKRGRTSARESEPVKPIPMPYVEAIKPYVSKQVWAMVQLQLFTAARAGELVALRPIDIDTTGKVWTCRPDQHKTAWHGHQRVIYFGPEAQKILKPFLAGRKVDACLFSPKEAEADRRAALHEARVTPMSCGNTPGSNRKRRPEWSPGDCYDVASYRRAIDRACKLADAEAHKKQPDVPAEQVIVPSWHPHQLRHNTATFLRKEFGLEVARVVLGHRSPAITETYAELDHAKAVEVIGRVG